MTDIDDAVDHRLLYVKCTKCNITREVYRVPGNYKNERHLRCYSCDSMVGHYHNE